MNHDWIQTLMNSFLFFIDITDENMRHTNLTEINSNNFYSREKKREGKIDRHIGIKTTRYESDNIRCNLVLNKFRIFHWKIKIKQVKEKEKFEDFVLNFDICQSIDVTLNIHHLRKFFYSFSEIWEIQIELIFLPLIIQVTNY